MEIAALLHAPAHLVFPADNLLAVMAVAARAAVQEQVALRAIHVKEEVVLHNALLRDLLQAESWEPAAQEQHAAHLHAEAAHGTALTMADGSGQLHSQAAAVQIIAPLHIATGL